MGWPYHLLPVGSISVQDSHPTEVLEGSPCFRQLHGASETFLEHFLKSLSK